MIDRDRRQLCKSYLTPHVFSLADALFSAPGWYINLEQLEAVAASERTSKGRKPAKDPRNALATAMKVMRQTLVGSGYELIAVYGAGYRVRKKEPGLVVSGQAPSQGDPWEARIDHDDTAKAA